MTTLSNIDTTALAQSLATLGAHYEREMAEADRECIKNARVGNRAILARYCEAKDILRLIRELEAAMSRYNELMQEVM